MENVGFDSLVMPDMFDSMFVDSMYVDSYFFDSLSFDTTPPRQNNETSNYIMVRTLRDIKTEGVIKPEKSEDDSTGNEFSMANRPSLDLTETFICKATKSHMQKRFIRRMKSDKSPTEKKKPKRVVVKRKKKPAPTYVTKKMRLSKFDDEDISPSIALDFVLGCPDS